MMVLITGRTTPVWQITCLTTGHPSRVDTAGSRPKILKQPERENPKEIKPVYRAEAAAGTEGYVLVESKATGYGYLYFKYVKIPAKRTRKNKELK